MTDQALGIKAADSLLRSCTSGQVRYQQPAPHGVIDDCFDPASLAAIQKHFPSLDEMQRTPSRSPAHRTTMPLADGKLGPSGLPDLCHSAAEFWGGFQQKLDCPDFRSQLTGAISNADPCRGTNSRPSPILKTLLVRDCDGFKKGPHVDAGSRIFTILIYLPDHRGFESLGTRVYVPVNPLAQFARDGTEHLFENFLDIKTIDFVSNRAFVLPRTAEAWHGAPTVQASQGQRKMILIAGMDKNLMDENQ